MDKKVSVVINTLNEEKNIERAIKSAAWADEIIVCDMHSKDKTVEIAKKLGARVIFFKEEGFVEPARNYAVSKASYDWIFILDADEEVQNVLAEKLRKIVTRLRSINYIEIPRKNIIFGKWMQNSGWWPDYQVRLFKKGKVFWQDKIHSKPKLNGEGIKLDPYENLAIIHHNYQTMEQFIERMNCYTSIEAEQIHKEGYKFSWKDLFEKPLNEFLSRFFANQGYKDGLHGLSASLLQAFSFLVVYLKLWQLNSFKPQEVALTEIKEEADKTQAALNYWFKDGNSPKNIFKTFLTKLKG